MFSRPIPSRPSPITANAPSSQQQPSTSVETDEQKSIFCAKSAQAAKSYILSNIFSEFVRLKVSKAIFEDREIQAILEPLEKDAEKYGWLKYYVYDYEICDLTIHTIAGFIHESACDFFNEQWWANRNSFLTNEECEQFAFSLSGQKYLRHSSGMPRDPRKKEATKKCPDGFIKCHESYAQVSWPVILEVGVSQPYDSLKCDVKQWLLKESFSLKPSPNPPKIVIIVNIEETHKSDSEASKQRRRDLVIKYGNEMITDAVLLEMKETDWVQPLKVFLEIWELDSNREAKIRGSRFDILPKPRRAENPTIPVTDIVPEDQRSQNFDAKREWVLDMDIFRQYLREGMTREARSRALNYVSAAGLDEEYR